MSSDSICNNAELSGELSSLNIGSNESNNDEKGGTINNNNVTTAILCANCGKEGGGDSMNTCNKCDLVKYCNVACKKKHRPKHKKKCEKRAAELFDEKLFQEPPPPEDCPICFLPLPLNVDQVTFFSCCGKDICNGCIYAMRKTGGKNMKLCPFCKAPPTRLPEEEVESIKKLMEKGHADAFNQLGGHYEDGTSGMPQDRAKANELYLKAGELGCANAYYNLGLSYNEGAGVEIDKKKAKHFYELAAMNGDLHARHNLGCVEGQAGNYHRSYKHFMLSAGAGCKESLNAVKGGYMAGYVTKDQYANTLREYHKSQDEMKSEARDKARAYNEIHHG